MPDKSLMFIHALTGLHPGGGTALGVVDLPVQRERPTDWPIIPGSSLKGVLRSACNRASGQGLDTCSHIVAAFGPATAGASEHAGAMTFSDARILAFPVRSLKGVFAWVTCPAVLERLSRDLTLVGGTSLPGIPRPKSNEAACPAVCPLVASGGKMVLEEFEFTCTENGGPIADFVARWATTDSHASERLKRHLVVLHDDDFTHFARHATEVVARIGLDYALKTVRKGALFYEEYIPAESLFYSVILCRDSYSQDNAATGAELMQWLERQRIAHLQVGGGETIGKGICAVRIALPQTSTKGQ